MSVRDDYGFLTTYMEYDEEDEEEVDWETIIAEFADYCSQLVPEDIAKDYSDQLVQK